MKKQDLHIRYSGDHFYRQNQDSTGVFIEEFLDYEEHKKLKDIVRGITRKEAEAIMKHLPKIKGE